MANLGSILSGTLDLLLGGSSNRGSNVPSDDRYTNVSGMLDNVLARISGSRLSDAEREANAFTAAREDLAWERQMYASNTAYQRQVADMQAAGLNPMLALGAGGASSPSVSSSGSVSPAGGSMNLGTLLSLVTLPSQLKNMKAEREVMNANAENIRAKTDETKSHLDWFNLTRDLEFKGLELSRSLDEKRIAELSQSIEESKHRVSNLIASTHEKDELANLHIEQAVLAKTTAQNIQFMQPFLARTESARASKDEASANLALVDAAYRQGLIDHGAIEAAVRASNASASEAEVRAAVGRVEEQIKSKDAALTPDPESKNIFERLVAGVRGASRAIQGK